MVCDADTPYEKIKVMDFGLAKLVNERRNLPMFHRTETGTDFAVGTPGYISPEQVRGDESGHRADLYSVGIILYELLTGKLPFQREDTMDVLIAHATEMPPSFADLGLADASIPPSVERVVLNCLAKDPEERPASARDLAQDFERAILEEEDLQAAEDGAPETQACILAAPPAPRKFDPAAMVFRMEAFLPDTLANYKLRYFAQDNNGEILSSEPGLIRVRIDDSTVSGWGLFRKRSVVDLALHLERTRPAQPNFLLVTVVMSSPDHKVAQSAAWRERCNQIFVDLRGYLAGNTIAAN
jgi:serine/threonine-protein kinase